MAPRVSRAVVIGLVALGAAVTTYRAGLGQAGNGGPRRHTIEVVARQYAFEPAVIRVERGDEVRLRFASKDVVHGFQLEGYGLDVVIEPLRREVVARRNGGPPESLQEVAFVADRPGKFRYRCSTTCGAMHPFMVGELLVGPNLLFWGASAAALVLLMVGLLWPAPREDAA